MKDLFPIGTRIKLPKTKKGSTEHHNVVRSTKKAGLDYVYYGGVSNGRHCLTASPNHRGGDFYFPEEIVPYEKPNRSVTKEDIIELMSQVASRQTGTIKLLDTEELNNIYNKWKTNLK